MNLIRILRWLCGAILTVSLMYQYSFAQQEETKRDTKFNSSSIDDLGKELSDNLKLSDSQQGRIRNILNEFQKELTGTAGNMNSEGSGDEPSPVDHTSKTRQDRTDVKDRNNDNEVDNNNVDVNTGTARTKSESEDNNMTGRSSRIVVSFERARIDADSRIEELLTPEQAVQYGKIKSEWWDKVRETIKPDNLRNDLLKERD